MRVAVDCDPVPPKGLEIRKSRIVICTGSFHPHCPTFVYANHLYANALVQAGFVRMSPLVFKTNEVEMSQLYKMLDAAFGPNNYWVDMEPEKDLSEDPDWVEFD